jgi:CRISPR/Cas system-associated exonuclease Cas4 (RecB family)
MGRQLPVAEGQLIVSVSQVKTWLMCPRKYQLRYVRGLPPAFVPVALAFGNSFHAAVARFYMGVQAGTVPEFESLLSVFHDIWQQQLDGPVPVQADDEEALAGIPDLAARMLRAFYVHAAGTPVQVEGIEQAFAVDLHDPDTGEVLDEKLVGFFDLVLRENKRRVIVELKTAAKKYTQDQLDFDLQPSAYQFAAEEMGWKGAVVKYAIVTKTKLAAVQEETVVRGPLARDDFLRTTVGVLRAIDAGVAHPMRGWQCRSCPFQAPCQTLGGGS